MTTPRSRAESTTWTEHQIGTWRTVILSTWYFKPSHKTWVLWDEPTATMETVFCSCRSEAVEQPSSWSATSWHYLSTFKRLLKTFLFGCWDRSTLCELKLRLISFLTYLLRSETWIVTLQRCGWVPAADGPALHITTVTSNAHCILQCTHPLVPRLSICSHLQNNTLHMRVSKQGSKTIYVRPFL